MLEAAVEAAGRDEPLPRHGLHRALRGARRHGSDVPTTHLAAGTGSVAVLYHLLQAFCEPGDEVVYAWRSFEAYPIAVAVTGATSVQVPLTAATRGTTSTRWPLRSPTAPRSSSCAAPTTRPGPPSARRARGVPGPGAVARRGGARRGLPRVRPRRGPVRRRRGLPRRAPTWWRCAPSPRPTGWPASGSGTPWRRSRSPPAVRACALPFGVSSVAQAAAVASLEREAELLERVEGIVAERDPGGRRAA